MFNLLKVYLAARFIDGSTRAAEASNPCGSSSSRIIQSESVRWAGLHRQRFEYYYLLKNNK